MAHPGPHWWPLRGQADFEKNVVVLLYRRFKVDPILMERPRQKQRWPKKYPTQPSSSAESPAAELIWQGSFQREPSWAPAAAALSLHIWKQGSKKTTLPRLRRGRQNGGLSVHIPTLSICPNRGNRALLAQREPREEAILRFKF